MQPEEYLDVVSPNEIRLKGHRIWLEHIIERYLAGETPEEIAAHLPTLSLDEVEATITYYHAHQAEIRAYLERLHELTQEQMRLSDAKPFATVERLRKLRDQLREERDVLHG